jgi:hypothetical protein
MISKLRIFATGMILAAAIGLPFGAAYAQAAIHLSQLTIRLWPEFDKPSVLVFFIGQTASDAALPAELKFTLPPGSTVNAIAYVDTVNNVLTDKVTHAIDGQNVSITTPNGNFHIEFYSPGLSINQQQRSYHFTWQANYVVDQLTWEVEQPPGATNFKVDLPGGTTITDENGLTVYQLKTTGLTVGQAASISVSYIKQTNTLTADTLAAAKSAPATTPQPAGGDTLTIVAAAAVLVLVIAGVAIYLRGGFAGMRMRPVGAAAPERRGRKARGRAAKKLGNKPAPGERFCPQCGAPALPDDLFCRTCGNQLHR